VGGLHLNILLLRFLRTRFFSENKHDLSSFLFRRKLRFLLSTNRNICICLLLKISLISTNANETRSQICLLCGLCTSPHQISGYFFSVKGGQQVF